MFFFFRLFFKTGVSPATTAGSGGAQPREKEVSSAQTTGSSGSPATQPASEACAHSKPATSADPEGGDVLMDTSNDATPAKPEKTSATGVEGKVPCQSHTSSEPAPAASDTSREFSNVGSTGREDFTSESATSDSQMPGSVPQSSATPVADEEEPMDTCDRPGSEAIAMDSSDSQTDALPVTEPSVPDSQEDKKESRGTSPTTCLSSKRTAEGQEEASVPVHREWPSVGGNCFCLQAAAGSQIFISGGKI